MILTPLDWSFVVLFFGISLAIGFWVGKTNATTKDYFSGGGNMPWWLLGVSMVATTFSTDTPNLVTDLVRQHGVGGNWIWWSFLFTGLLTTFVYAKLWKRSGVLTDVEFYELRYSGEASRFLRGFRAIYLGVVFNVLIMASVTLAAIKIGGVLLGLSPVQTVLIAGFVTVAYSSIGGFKGVLITDFVQFFLSIGGAVIAAVVALNHPKVGGLTNLLQHELVVDKLNFFPSISNPEIFISFLLVPLLIQWWSVWYPGAEPGGGGYVAQRMLAAKNEQHAMKAVLFFNFAHYALRPWPWIIVALCSLVVFPDLQSINSAFPNVSAIIGHDLAYPAMLTFVPAGLLGIVVSSLIAAYMSTISTHLNWGASYVVNDYYKRFYKPEASEKQMLRVGKISTVLLMLLAMLLALALENALSAFQILMQIGAGTGLLFILRWFWWRINAYSEIAAMGMSFLVAIYFRFFHVMLGFEALKAWEEMVLGVGITTIFWVAVTYLSPSTDFNVLINFIRKTRPGGRGWSRIMKKAHSEGMDTKSMVSADNMPLAILAVLLSAISIYGLLISTGLLIYGNLIMGLGILSLSGVSALTLFKLWRIKLKGDLP